MGISDCKKLLKKTFQRNSLKKGLLNKNQFLNLEAGPAVKKKSQVIWHCVIAEIIQIVLGT